MPTVVQMAFFLFLMIGPFKIIGPFAKMTEKASPKLTNQIAFKAILLSILGLLVASFMGENILNNFGVPIPILAMTGGIILFLVALTNVIHQYAPNEPEPGQSEPTLAIALRPLAFPVIVTPYGLSAVIVFMAISPTFNDKLIIGGIVICIMALNMIIMMLTKHFGRVIFIILSILGAVLGVVQVAIGLMIIISQFKIVFGIN